LYLARRYEEALEQAAETIEMDPAYTALYYDLGRVYERQGEYRRAIDAFHKVSLESHPRGATVLAAIGYAHAKVGDRDEARDVLEKLDELSTHVYVPSYELALLHLALGDTNRAFVQLSKAYDDFSSFLPFFNVDARFDEVRTDPRFQTLVQRLNFPTKV
jgi:serine/threonine-protein kinase